MGFFDLDVFSKISPQIPIVEDYFDFPSSLIAFGESLSNSGLYSPHQGVFFRRRNKQLTLITYFCNDIYLISAMEELKKEGYEIKTLNYVNKNMSHLQKVFYMDEYWVNEKYSLEEAISHHSKKHRYNILRQIKICEGKYTMFRIYPNLITIDKIMDVFNGWVEFAKERHFMVMKGHYQKYIKRFFEKENNVILIGFVRNLDNKLFGFAGFEYFKTNVQITLMKHLGGDYAFPCYFWIKTIYYILNQYPDIKKVFCGTTANKLKDLLGFNKEKSFKLIF